MQGFLSSRVKFVRDPDLDQVEARLSNYRQRVFRKHTHDSYAIGLVKQGVSDFWYENETIPIHAGDIALINPQGVHACNPRPGGALTYCMFYVEINLMRDITRGVLERDCGWPSFTKAVVQNPRLWQAFYTLYALMQNSNDLLEKQTCLYEALSDVVSLYTDCRVPQVSTKTCPGPMRKAQEYLVDNISRNVSLEELSALVHLSPYHFLRQFRAVFGMPPHTYRLQHRIQIARKMLADGVAIARVASDTGFTDQSHFTKKFKDYVGATPGQYRLAGQ